MGTIGMMGFRALNAKPPGELSSCQRGFGWFLNGSNATVCPISPQLSGGLGGLGFRVQHVSVQFSAAFVKPTTWVPFQTSLGKFPGLQA